MTARKGQTRGGLGALDSHIPRCIRSESLQRFGNFYQVLLFSGNKPEIVYDDMI